MSDNDYTNQIKMQRLLELNEKVEKFYKEKKIDEHHYLIVEKKISKFLKEVDTRGPAPPPPPPGMNR